MKFNPFTGTLDIDSKQSITSLDSRYVNITGDTLTGDLILFDNTVHVKDYTLTIPATGTAALLATANVFTADQAITKANPYITLTNSNDSSTLSIDNASGARFVASGAMTFTSNGAATDISFNHINATILVIDGASDRVGIGIASPLELLHVAGNIRAANAANPNLYATHTTNTVKSKLQSLGTSGLVGTESNHAFGIYSNNTVRIYINNTGEVGINIGSVAPSARLHVVETTTTTNAVLTVQRIEARVSTAATGGANGFGVGQSFWAETATDGTNQQQGLISTSWIDSTNATRKAKLSLSAYDTAARLGLEIQASGTESMIGFHGVTPIVRAVLATGAGATVDDVITALQNLGLVKQS